MDDRNHVINYKGKDILYVNHNGLEGNKIIENMKNAVKKTEELAKNGNEILAIYDFTDVYVTEEVMNYLKSDETKNVMKYIKKSAVIGIVGIKKIFLNVFNAVTSANTKAFDKLDEAKEWLVKN